MTVTENYTRTHRALIDAAAGHDASPLMLRLLVALAEAEPHRLDTEQLALQLSCDGSSVRRHIVELVERGWATHRSVGGGKVRRGVRSELLLSERGLEIAHDVILLSGRELP